MLVLRLARELGKFPHEVVESSSPESLLIWAAHFSLESEDFRAPEPVNVEAQLVNALGKPK